jgi:hypothetical protein
VSEDAVLAALARLEAGQARLEVGQTRLDAGYTNLRVDLMARMDRLQARIDQLAQECFVNYAQGETVRRHSDHTRSESRDLVDQISGLVRQVRALRDRIDAVENKDGA